MHKIKWKKAIIFAPKLTINHSPHGSIFEQINQIIRFTPILAPRICSNLFYWSSMSKWVKIQHFRCLTWFLYILWPRIICGSQNLYSQKKTFPYKCYRGCNIRWLKGSNVQKMKTNIKYVKLTSLALPYQNNIAISSYIII